MSTEDDFTAYLPQKQLLDEEKTVPTVIVERPPSFVLPENLTLVEPEDHPS